MPYSKRHTCLLALPTEVWTVSLYPHFGDLTFGDCPRLVLVTWQQILLKILFLKKALQFWLTSMWSLQHKQVYLLKQSAPCNSKYSINLKVLHIYKSLSEQYLKTFNHNFNFKKLFLVKISEWNLCVTGRLESHNYIFILNSKNMWYVII